MDKIQKLAQKTFEAQQQMAQAQLEQMQQLAKLQVEQLQQGQAQSIEALQQLLGAIQEHSEEQERRRGAAETERNSERQLRRSMSAAARTFVRKCAEAEHEIEAGKKAGSARVDAILAAARQFRELLPESERDPEAAAERAEYEALVRQQQELAAQLEAKAKLMAELG